MSWSSPWFIVLEGLCSLLVSQKLGQIGRQLAGEGEIYQFSLLIASAVAYVVSAWWIIVVSQNSYFSIINLIIIDHETGLSQFCDQPISGHSSWSCNYIIHFSYIDRIQLTTIKYY